jgi:hypothetical protein
LVIRPTGIRVGQELLRVFGLESTKDVDATKKANDLSKRRLTKSAHRTRELTTGEFDLLKIVKAAPAPFCK